MCLLNYLLNIYGCCCCEILIHYGSCSNHVTACCVSCDLQSEVCLLLLAPRCPWLLCPLTAFVTVSARSHCQVSRPDVHWSAVSAVFPAFAFFISCTRRLAALLTAPLAATVEQVHVKSLSVNDDVFFRSIRYTATLVFILKYLHSQEKKWLSEWITYNRQYTIISKQNKARKEIQSRARS